MVGIIQNVGRNLEFTQKWRQFFLVVVLMESYTLCRKKITYQVEGKKEGIMYKLALYCLNLLKDTSDSLPSDYVKL